MRRTHRRSRPDGANWLSFSDLMSSLLLIFVLIMFYIMYQYFDMYEINMAEIARQQFDLDQANASLDEKTAKLTLAEQQMIAQQIKLDAAQKELTEAEDVLQRQQAELSDAQALLTEKEAEIEGQKASLEQLSSQLTDREAQILVQQQTLSDQQTTLDTQRVTLEQQQAQLNEQQAKLDTQQTTLDEQQSTMDRQRQALAAQQVTLDQAQATVAAQQDRLEEQQQTLEQQQVQIEQLVGLKTRIITSLSDALRAANISAQVDPTNGSIALKSDVLFETNKFELTDRGKAFVDRFLPVYLNVLLGDDYRQYVSEIIIEGHTDSLGDYITNLKLSQQRALAVASYVLADDYNKITPAQKRLLRALATANGRSWSDLVRDASGREDMDASRRVVFKFRMTDEQMIQQLKDIMEQN